MAAHVRPLQSEHVPAAAAVVARRVAELREAVPALPPTFAINANVEAALTRLLDAGHGLVALADDGSVLGHLCWREFATFRRAPRRAAYVPEYGSALATHAPPTVRHQLFTAAAEQWDASARQVVAITQLDGDPTADEYWVANGFGRFLQDGVRPCTGLEVSTPDGYEVRPATVDDLDRLVQLDGEHCRHYGEPPVFMVPPQPATAEELAPLLTGPPAVWVAADDHGPQAFLRTEVGGDSCSEFVCAPDTMAVTGIFTRPAARGRGVGVALFDAALRHHATQDIPRAGFDYETINPTALAFWPRLVTTVARSYMRVLERC